MIHINIETWSVIFLKCKNGISFNWTVFVCQYFELLNYPKLVKILLLVHYQITTAIFLWLNFM